MLSTKQMEKLTNAARAAKQYIAEEAAEQSRMAAGDAKVAEQMREYLKKFWEAAPDVSTHPEAFKKFVKAVWGTDVIREVLFQVERARGKQEGEIPNMNKALLTPENWDDVIEPLFAEDREVRAAAFARLTAKPAVGGREVRR